MTNQSETGLSGPVLEFTVSCNSTREAPTGCGVYLYESILVLWLRAWVDHVESTLVEESNSLGSSDKPFATFALPPYDPNAALPKCIFSFYAHMDILLPLSLKSIILRYSQEVLPLHSPNSRAIMDDKHCAVFEPFVEMLARGLMGQALAGMGSPESRDKALVRSLASSDIVLEFLVGLVAVLHPVHIHSLVSRFLKTLRECETEHLGNEFTELDFEWSEESLHRVRCSRHLRLRTVESFAVLPSFLALNTPPKYIGHNESSKTKRVHWLRQYIEIPDGSPGSEVKSSPYSSLRGGWLGELIISEGLSLCSLSCEAVVAEAMAHIEVVTNRKGKAPSAVPSLKKRPGASLKRVDLLMFQSIAIHAITCVYELVLRRHSMDRRFQTESCRERIAVLFAKPILDKSVASVRWLARMESTHKVRSLWLLSFVCVLQEAPECMIRDYLRTLCNPKVGSKTRCLRWSALKMLTCFPCSLKLVSQEVRIHRFIRLLRLCSSSFQSFLDLPKHALFPSEIDKGLSPWLLQESFNTICAATNTVVEECVHLTSSYPEEQEKIMVGILDLLLHLLTTPQSSVTHLRAVGGALQALEYFGIELFLETVGSNLQHWLRVILSLMNSTSLSVRSIAVDFVVQLFGGAFDMHGNVDGITLIFVTVLPEVIAREIALQSVSGHISRAADIETAVWPLRRSIADLEDANPLDDERVDSQLVPVLSVFCRACQAVIDGVLIELRLRGPDSAVVGVRIAHSVDSDATFDADEESLFEAATFFAPETSPMQRLRWLLTLKCLHERKEQWVEAAETLFLCARTISDSIPHLKTVWRPSKFVLWLDSRRSLWLDTVGEEMGLPDRGNTQVMDFADDFLEPEEKFGSMSKSSTNGQLHQPTVTFMSSMLVALEKEAVEHYRRSEGTDEILHAHLESLFRKLMGVLDDYTSKVLPRSSNRVMSAIARKRRMEDEAAVRRVIAAISGDMTKLAERLLMTVRAEVAPRDYKKEGSLPINRQAAACEKLIYAVLLLRGRKPSRFQESTGLPTFIEFDTPCICRLPEAITKDMRLRSSAVDEQIIVKFAQPYLRALRKDCGSDAVALVTEPPSVKYADCDARAYLHIFPVEVVSTEFAFPNQSHAKSFYYRKDLFDESKSLMVEMTVAHPFPCPLSRQRSLVTTEIASTQAKMLR